MSYLSLKKRFLFQPMSFDTADEKPVAMRCIDNKKLRFRFSLKKIIEKKNHKNVRIIQQPLPVRKGSGKDKTHS